MLGDRFELGLALADWLQHVMNSDAHLSRKMSKDTPYVRAHQKESVTCLQLFSSHSFGHRCVAWFAGTKKLLLDVSWSVTGRESSASWCDSSSVGSTPSKLQARVDVLDGVC